ncbi:hypothetical protein [Virgisporangium aurantiacum]|uniref:Uncharacterized protein n=1 Tax=Virgisporangium aurantiacum TaxID=175570 RepID=A0A8J3ZK32_9ACTN|nr:hypothetical protein [Virgisporangium aurantiacum]GIJ62961.1 hypothetical protein Vau01_104770 [Virgisporangium aurantiacum]
MTDLALWLAGAGHFALLAVSVQLPAHLDWRSDLAKLTDFNRRFVWVAGGFIVFTYLGFGVLTLLLHDEMVRGDRSAAALAAFIGLYWLVRVVVDATAFRGAPWPRGWLFRLGHLALVALFGYFVVVYLGLAVWHLR